MPCQASQSEPSLSRTAAGLLVAVLAMGATEAVADPCEAIPRTGSLPPHLRPGSTFEGPVNRVLDGDGLCVALGPSPGEWVEVRLADFYAPELHEPEGAAARSTLAKLVLRQRLRCVSQKTNAVRLLTPDEGSGLLRLEASLVGGLSYW